jgi:hypothetical protein
MKVADNKIRIMAVGDIMLGDSSHFLGRGVGSVARKRDASYIFENVRGLFSEADLFFGNLESPISQTKERHYRRKVYRAPVSAGPALQLAPVNVVSLANNHILQHGPLIMQETQRILHQNGIHYAGFSVNGSDDSYSQVVHSRNNIISIHCESLVKDQSGQVVDPSSVEDRITRSLAMVRADIKIVSLHWGAEYVPFPSFLQQNFAHRLVDLGANLILGHHPHVLQPVEEYKGALIAYSLGNFVFDQRWGYDVQTGGILDIQLSPGKQIWKLHLTEINDSFQPVEASSARQGERLKGLEKPIQILDINYSSSAAKYSRKMRARMKLELIKHFWKVSPDTWLYLLTNRWFKARNKRNGL